MWIPSSEGAIRQAIEQGTFVESHFLDAKAITGDTDGERKETARDLASFSLDGGVLVIGVSEDKKASTFSLAPVCLAGLMEKLEQIAATRIDPPLYVRPREIVSEESPTLGYLVVEIPPSPRAPHMTDGRYYTRGERTKRQMSDSEVIHLHQSRLRENELISDLLREEMSRDPVAVESREHGHIYLVAEPLNAAPGMAETLVRDPLGTKLNEILNTSNRLPIGSVSGYAPGAPGMRGSTTRSRGAGFTSSQDGKREVAGGAQEHYLSDVEFHEDGGIRAVVGRGTDSFSRNSYAESSATEIIFDGVCLGYAHRLVYWAAQTGSEIGYRGSWGLGIAADGLMGKASSLYYTDFWGSGAILYDRDEYLQTTTARFDELIDNPRAVAHRLVGRLLRGLATDTHWASEFEQPDVEP